MKRVLMLLTLMILAVGCGSPDGAAPDSADNAAAPMDAPADTASQADTQAADDAPADGNVAAQDDTAGNAAAGEAAMADTNAGSKEQPADAAQTGASADTETDATAADDAAAGTDAETVTYELLPEGSQASYRVDEQFFDGAVRLDKVPGMVETVGTTSVVDGQFTVTTGSPPELVDGTFTVDISTLQSDDRRRDRKIREDWLQSGIFPMATFDAQRIEGLEAPPAAGETVEFQLAGEMTVRETTQPTTWTITLTNEGGRLAGSAVTTLLMTDFGFQPPSFMGVFEVADEVEVTLDFSAAPVG